MQQFLFWFLLGVVIGLSKKFTTGQAIIVSLSILILFFATFDVYVKKNSAGTVIGIATGNTKIFDKIKSDIDNKNKGE